MEQDEVKELAYKIYQYYFNQKIKVKTGKPARLIKNWKKVEENEAWPYILQFADRVLKSNGQINYKLYIQALFDFSNNQWFSPTLFTSLKGIEIYKHFIRTLNQSQDPDKIWEGIISSIKFVVKFCKERGIKSWSDYFYFNPGDLKSLYYFMDRNAMNNALVTSIKESGLKELNGKRLHFMPVACYAYIVGENTLNQTKSMYGL